MHIKNTLKSWPCAVLILLTLALPQAAAAMEYKTIGDCNGFPRVDLSTAPGYCVGLVASHLGFARGVAVVGSSVFVVDMGGWHKGKGRLLRLGEKGHGKPEVLLKGLDEPNAIVATTKGTLYIGELGKVFEFDPSASAPAQAVRDVVTGLPDNGRHPLSALALANDGSLFINIGSVTDNCESTDGVPAHGGTCPETTGSRPRAIIVHVMPKADGPVDAMSGEIVARGLRNSMALALLPGGQLMAAVNARDSIDQADPKLSDEDLPHDTLNLIEKSADYGWPYCYDNNINSPEYPMFDCKNRHLPTLLLPPHAAPLGMLYYSAKLLPGLKNHLVIAYHGYRAHGHRIMALALDDKGLPKGDPKEIVWNWELADGNHPKGAPVALVQMADGSILITEDLNSMLLRIAQTGVIAKKQ